MSWGKHGRNRWKRQSRHQTASLWLTGYTPAATKTLFGCPEGRNQTRLPHREGLFVRVNHDRLGVVIREWVIVAGLDDPFGNLGRCPCRRDTDALLPQAQVAVEQRGVAWPAVSVGSDSGQAAVGDWEVLTAEMKRYEYVAGTSGQVTYSAPSGYHDDCVMALALAVWGCRAAGIEPGRMARFPARRTARRPPRHGYADENPRTRRRCVSP